MTYKRWLLFSVFLFLAGLMWGLVTPLESPSLLAEDIAELKELSDSLSPLPQESVFIFIFLKNVLALLISFVFSPFLCLVPAMALILNGGILGAVSVIVSQEESLGFLLASLLPHGVFELPALFMGEAAAFGFGAAVIMALFKKERRKLLAEDIRQNLKLLVISFALLFIAAIVETYLTPLFINR